MVVNSGEHTVLMRLRNGTEHRLMRDNEPDPIQISTFGDGTSAAVGAQEDAHIGRSDTPILAMTNRRALEHAKGPGGKCYLMSSISGSLIRRPAWF